MLSSIINTALSQYPARQKAPASNVSETAAAPQPSRRDNFVGSGLNLELELKSGVQIQVALRQDGSGQIRDMQIEADGPLQDGQLATFKAFMNDLGSAVDKLFSNQQSAADIFAFANQSGIADVELSIQQEKGDVKQRVEFEKLQSPTGRKEVNAEWLSFDRNSGIERKHNLALSREDGQAKSASGSDYQWLLENIKSGVDVMGMPSESEGALNAQERQTLFEFFSSGIYALFDQTQTGMSKLQSIGASQTRAKKFIEQSVTAFSYQASSKSAADTSASKGSGFKNLPDFKADFSSQQTARNSQDKEDEYQFAMEISQASRWVNQQDDVTQESKNSLIQNRRLLVQYEHVGQLKEFEFNWQHDEFYKADYVNQVLQQSRFTTQDVTNSQLVNRLPDSQGSYSVKNSNSQYSNTETYSNSSTRTPIGSILGGGYRV